MTIVIGQIESLNRLKSTLSEKGIDRFNSIREINDFTKSYELEKQQIINQVEQDLKTENDALHEDSVKWQNKCDNLISKNKNKLNKRISRLESKYELINSKNTNKLLKKTFNWIRQKILQIIIAYLRNNYHDIIKRNSYKLEMSLYHIKLKIYENNINRDKIISDRSTSKLNNLNYTKKVIDELYPLIAGAVGESLVEKEIRKLSDDYTLFNDYRLNFKPPIYNKKTKDRIFSIQLDHLLISRAGIFILETKNWSKESINSLDLRSPVDQIIRTSYAMFVVANKIHLKKHHWGEKQIPIRNVIVMIHEKPKFDFKYVKIKQLKELNCYIQNFESIFSKGEVESIANTLIRIRN